VSVYVNVNYLIAGDYYTGEVDQLSQSQSATGHDSDVSAPANTSRGSDHLRWQDGQQPTNHSRRSDVEPAHANDDVTATTSGLSAVLGALDEVPLFYIALTSGASLTACVMSVCPSWVVALVAVTSLVSFAADSVHSYLVT